MHYSFHITKTIKDRRPLIFIKGIDLSAILYEKSADIRIRINIGGMESKMMQRVSFVHIEEVRINSKCQ
jgi:hypothetical protein